MRYDGRSPPHLVERPFVILADPIESEPSTGIDVRQGIWPQACNASTQYAVPAFNTPYFTLRICQPLIETVAIPVLSLAEEEDAVLLSVPRVDSDTA